MRNWSETEINILWIRHGMTKGNEEHRYIGTTDEPLSENGRITLKEQWKTNGNLLRKVDKIYTSPMLRCQETAELLWPGRKREIVVQWREMDFGAFEYKNYRELNGNPQYQAWIDSNGTLPFPGGESKELFTERCMHGWNTLVKQWKKSENPPQSVACVAHGGTIMAVLSQLQGGDYFDYQLPNGGFITMKFK